MGVKRCGNCDEIVDESKAFCSGCGAALLQEDSREASNFEKMDSTVQLGQTMYNQMLSDMGLNLSKANPAKGPVEIAPAALEPEKKPPDATQNRERWVIFIVLGLVLVGTIILIATVLFYYYAFGPDSTFPAP